MAVCSACGCAQAVIDATWQAEADEIYRKYQIYHQSKGVEQSVFDAATGAATSRSSRLLRRVIAGAPVGENGRLLDIGCGNGALLRAFSELLPNWSLAGAEYNDHNRAVIESIRGVEKLYTGSPTEIPGDFDIISLIHTLEHIPDPGAFIGTIWDKLKVGGLLLIQVPDCSQNPFMYLVADHSSHFFPAILKEIVAASGYEVLTVADDWVAKEITLIARKPGPKRLARPVGFGFDTAPSVGRSLDWLDTTVQLARSLADGPTFGLFGTSIAATWLWAELEGRVGFFVDEDPHRAGQSLNGLPIYSPAKVPAGGRVMVALPSKLAAGVRERLGQLRDDVTYLAPPPIAS